MLCNAHVLNSAQLASGQRLNWTAGTTSHALTWRESDHCLSVLELCVTYSSGSGTSRLFPGPLGWTGVSLVQLEPTGGAGCSTCAVPASLGSAPRLPIPERTGTLFLSRRCGRGAIYRYQQHEPRAGPSSPGTALIDAAHSAAPREELGAAPRGFGPPRTCAAAFGPQRGFWAATRALRKPNKRIPGIGKRFGQRVPLLPKGHSWNRSAAFKLTRTQSTKAVPFLSLPEIWIFNAAQLPRRQTAGARHSLRFAAAAAPQRPAALTRPTPPPPSAQAPLGRLAGVLAGRGSPLPHGMAALWRRGERFLGLPGPGRTARALSGTPPPRPAASGPRSRPAARSRSVSRSVATSRGRGEACGCLTWANALPRGAAVPRRPARAVRAASPRSGSRSRGPYVPEGKGRTRAARPRLSPGVTRAACPPRWSTEKSPSLRAARGLGAEGCWSLGCLAWAAGCSVKALLRSLLINKKLFLTSGWISDLPCRSELLCKNVLTCGRWAVGEACFPLSAVSCLWGSWARRAW